MHLKDVHGSRRPTSFCDEKEASLWILFSMQLDRNIAYFNGNKYKLASLSLCLHIFARWHVLGGL